MPTKEKEAMEYEKAPMCLSARLSLAFQGTFAITVAYLLRANFGFAIMCMTSTSQPTKGNFSAINDQSTEWPLLDYDAYILKTNKSELLFGRRPVTEVDTTGSLIDPGEGLCIDFMAESSQEDGEFAWQKHLQGLMLSAFFWGYIITQVPGGWLATKYGGKYVMEGGMLLTIVANTLIPTAARLHPYLILPLRFIMGLGQGVVYPSMHCLWGRWAPPLERSKLIAFSYSGAMLGTVLAMSVSGFLCEIKVDRGWPFIFYSSGILAFIVLVLFQFMAFNSPSQHPRISDLEKTYIERSTGISQSHKKDIPVPWCSILTSKPMWAIIVAHFCTNWGLYTMLTSIPTYMREVLRFDIKSNGVLSALPFICMYIMTNIGSQLADLLRRKHILNTTKVRKMCQVIGFLIPSVFICILGFIKCDRRYTAVACLTVAVSFTGFGRSGHNVNHVDIAPRFSGILFGITNTAATIPGMVAPYIASALTKSGTQQEWQIVFFICGGIYAFGCLIYVLFASGEQQQWAKVPSDNVMVIDVKHQPLLIDYNHDTEKNGIVKT